MVGGGGALVGGEAGGSHAGFFRVHLEGEGVGWGASPSPSYLNLVGGLVWVPQHSPSPEASP